MEARGALMSLRQASRTHDGPAAERYGNPCYPWPLTPHACVGTVLQAMGGDLSRRNRVPTWGGQSIWRAADSARSTARLTSDTASIMPSAAARMSYTDEASTAVTSSR
jgi:hypothetical protein